MSISAQLVVWNAGRAVDGPCLIALLALADWADDDGYVVYQRATVDRLAHRIRRSTRQTQRVLNAVQTRGWLEVSSCPGRPNTYRLRLDVLRALGAGEGKRGDTLGVTPDTGATPDTLDVTPTPDAGVVGGVSSDVGGGVTSRMSSHIPVVPDHTTTTTTGGGDQDLILPTWPTTWPPNLQQSVGEAIHQAPLSLRQLLADELAGALAAGHHIPNPVGWLRAVSERWANGPTPEYAPSAVGARTAAANPGRDPTHLARVRELAGAVQHWRNLGQPQLAVRELEELHKLAPNHPLVTHHPEPEGATT